jgi:hypothetical protein
MEKKFHKKLRSGSAAFFTQKKGEFWQKIRQKTKLKLNNWEMK